MTRKAKAIILHASGSNRNHEALWACERAGARSEALHMSALTQAKVLDAQMLVLAGGFSYGDALGAGRRWAFELELGFKEQLEAFIASGKPVIGICNGFQVLLKGGYLDLRDEQATLSHNLHPSGEARFECRWVYLQPNPQSNSPLIRSLTEGIYCPVAHGEGRFLAKGRIPRGQIAFQYADAQGAICGDYPYNPNGSLESIAGVTNAQGNVLGLMPHPEDHILDIQHPRWQRNESGHSGLALLQSAIAYAKAFL